MLEIDGSAGEGGGQILRSALALAACRGLSFQIRAIRARRAKPGLRPQHLAAVNATAAVCSARVAGAELGSQSLAFRPGRVQGGDFRFDIGTAGSALLVLQTVLPALLTAREASTVTICGGTHNAWAPTYEFIASVYLPCLHAMGAEVALTLERRGFYPRGGGEIRATIAPQTVWRHLELTERGGIEALEAEALIARLPPHVAERELEVLRASLGGHPLATRRVVDPVAGPGNVVTVRVRCEHVMELFASIGQRGLRAEKVAARVCAETQRYIENGAPVGPYLADQLLLPFTLAGSGRFRCTEITSHFATNRQLLTAMAGAGFTVEPDGRRGFLVTRT